MLKLGGLILLVGIITTLDATRTVNNHLSAPASTRIGKTFLEGATSNDIQAIYYSAINNHEELVLGDKHNTCLKLPTVYAESKLNDFEKNFYLIGAYKILGCSKPLSPAITQAVAASLSKDAATSQEVYYNFFASKLAKVDIDETVKAKVGKNLQTILKKDDSLSSLGHAFYVASELGTHGEFVNDRIEDAIVQADEVDGKMLQFEGGLSITALVLTGALKLTSALNKPAPITTEQAVKFATYFLSRSSVQTPKGASVLLEALQGISQHKSIAPICIQLAGNGQLLPEAPVLSVKVSDLLGKPLTPALAALTTTITSKDTNAVLITKVNLVPSRTDSTLFTLDLQKTNTARGQYKVEIDANTFKQTLKINVLGKVKVSSLEVGVGDSDSTSAVKKQNVVYPNMLESPLNADSQQKIVLKTALVDEASGKPISVHQAFVLLRNMQFGDEIIFVAEQDSSKAYKFEMDVGTRSSDFGQKSGVYSLELIVGDSLISNSFRWHLTDVHLKFPQDLSNESVHPARTPLPEIVHQFRAPEKRPPRFFSDVFTGLCLAPLVLLFAFWGNLRANISNFPRSLSAVGFHLGLGAILSLFIIFWLQLNMFDTIRYLLPLALVTFLCGNKLLRAIAARNSSEK